MKISIITAVYNREHLISEAIESVQSQIYGNVEHLVQDGASTDATVSAICKVAKPSLRLASEPDFGIYDAINKGIMRSTGDIVGLMHSDDLFAHSQVLSLIADKFDKTDADGIYGDLQYVSAHDSSRVVRHWRSGDFSLSKLRRGWMPPHPTLYLRREVFDRWGLYDTSLRISADYEAMLRYLMRGGISLAYIPEVLVKMRVGGESNRSLSTMILKSREDLAAIRQHNLGGVGTLVRKNVSKIRQYFIKR